MLSNCAFRAQLALPGQRMLFDYWQDISEDRAMPVRAHFDPLKFPHLLPDLGLIDLREEFYRGISGSRARGCGTSISEKLQGYASRRYSQELALRHGERFIRALRQRPCVLRACCRLEKRKAIMWSFNGCVCPSRTMVRESSAFFAMTYAMAACCTRRSVFLVQKPLLSSRGRAGGGLARDCPRVGLTRSQGGRARCRPPCD